MTVKESGRYRLKDNQTVEVYGFDSLGGGDWLAEGFFETSRRMGHWNPETGAYVHIFKDEGKNYSDFDIVEAL